MGVCPYCDKEFENKSLGGHVARCKMNPNYKSTIEKDRKNLKKATDASALVKKLPRLEFIQICPKCGKEFTVIGTQNDFNKGKLRKFCSRKCANSRNFNEESKQKKSNALKQYYSEHNPPVGFCGNIDNNGNYQKYKIYDCKYCGKQFTIIDDRDTGGRKYCSSECRQKWIKENVKWGGQREGSGHSKSGWYKGIYCSSTWELAYLIYCLDHNIPIERCKEERTYIYKGKLHKYYPDFVTSEGIIEIKGYSTKQWEAKQVQNSDIIVLYKQDIEKYLKYVHDNYTNNLTELYDDSKPIILTKTCWVHKGDINTIIKSELLDEYINSGWIRGRKNKQKIKV